MPIRIRDALVEEMAMAILDTLDGNLTLHEQVVCLQSVLALALAELPPGERDAFRRTHQAALDALAEGHQ